MNRIEEFRSWLKEFTYLRDSSIYKYSLAINTISKEMLFKGIIDEDLYSMSSLQYEIAMSLILKEPDFIIKNKRGDAMYSNALKHYRTFNLYNKEHIYIEDILNIIDKNNSLNETERVSLIKSRIGQGIFRHNVRKKYNNRCAITGIKNDRLLIASHIKPWAFSNNEERISSENGILLSPTYDKLFDLGLITFSNNGNLYVSKMVSKDDISRINIPVGNRFDLGITDEMKNNLEYHREMIFLK